VVVSFLSKPARRRLELLRRSIALLSRKGLKGDFLFKCLRGQRKTVASKMLPTGYSLGGLLSGHRGEDYSLEALSSTEFVNKLYLLKNGP
jgi:hypothetical protein